MMTATARSAACSDAKAPAAEVVAWCVDQGVRHVQHSAVHAVHAARRRGGEGLGDAIGPWSFQPRLIFLLYSFTQHNVVAVHA